MIDESSKRLTRNTTIFPSGQTDSRSLRISGHGHNLLVVTNSKEDSETIQRELIRENQTYLHSPQSASCHTFNCALEFLQDQNFDIVILDYSLPDTVGLSGLVKLRESYPHVPVILYTGNNYEAVGIAALKIGAQDYVFKEGLAGNLQRIVRHALERNEIETESRLAQTVAYSANQAKTDFLANVSHEIRTPLTAILVFNEIAMEEVTTPSQHNALRSVKRNCDHLIQVINNVLDLSKIENRGVEVRNSSFNPATILEEIEFTFKNRALDKGITYKCEYRFPLPLTIFSDALYLKQILFNLVGNAIKFTNTGGVKVVGSYNSALNQYIIKVIDTGVGISAECAAILFEPFSQGDTSTTRKFGGTGLGLTISRKLATALCGTLVFDSKFGEGCTFTLSIDAGANAASNLVDHFDIVPSVPESSQNLDFKFNGKVLIVDDLPDNRALLSYFVNQIGAKISLAENGLVALEMVAKEQFDVILMDMQMPVLDGYSCATKLREMNSKIPIIAITATALSGAKDQCLKAGCSAYLCKPFTKEELIATIAQQLPSRGVRNINSKIEVSYGQFKKPADPGLLPIARNFAHQFPERVRSLISSYHQCNLEELQNQAHQLAAAQMFGFTDIGKAARELEEKVKGRDYSALDGLIRQLERLAEHIVISESEIELLMQDHSLRTLPAAN